MAEALIAQLGLDLSGFTSGLQQAQAAMQAFAQHAAQAMAQATHALTQHTLAIQKATQASHAQAQSQQNTAQQHQANTQATNQLAAAYLAMAQSIQQQTHAYTQAQAAALQFRQAQAAAVQATAHATTIWDRFTRAIMNTALYGSAYRLLSLIESLPATIGHGLLAATQGFAEFQEGILKIGSQIAGFTAGALFEAMGAQVHALAQRFGRDTGDINKALFELQGTFGDTAKAMTVLEASGQLAVGGFTNIFDASQAISSVLKGLKLDVSESANVANALKIGADQGRASVGEFAKSISGVTPTISAFRVDLREANAALAVLTNQGYTTGEAVTALSRILFAIGAPTVRAQKYMEELAKQMGIAKIDFVRNKDGVADLFATLQQFTSISPDLFRRIFGGSEVITKGIIGLTDHMGELRTKIDEAVAGGNNLKDAQTLAGTGITQVWKEAQQTIQYFADTLGAMIAKNPEILRSIREIQRSFTSVTGSILANKKELETLITAFAKLGEIGISALEGISHVAVYLAGAIGATINAIAAGITNVKKAAQDVQTFATTGLGGGGSKAQFGGPGSTYAGGMNPSGPLTPEEQRWADAVKALNAPPTPSGAIVSPPKPPPRFSLDNVDPSGSERASNRAAHAAEKLARERERIEEHLHDTLFALNHDTFDTAQRLLEQEVAAARKAGADKLLIAEYYKDQSAVIAHNRAMAEIQELMEELQEEQQLREDDLKNLQTIDDILRETSAKTLQRELADIKAAYVQKRTMLVEAGANDIQIAQLNANEQTALRHVQAEEIDKERQKIEDAYQEMVSTIAGTLRNVFENILSGTGDLLDNLKQMFTRFLATLAAQAAAGILVNVVFGGGGGGSGGVSTFLGALSNILGVDVGSANAGSTGLLQGPTQSGGTLDTVGVGGQLIGGASTLSGMLGGPTVMSSLLGATGLGTLAATELGELGLSGAAYAGGEAGSLGGLAGTTIGELLGAAGIGIFAGMISSQILGAIGLHGTANAVTAGAIGGATAGTLLMPGIGTAIGVAVGALGGFVASLFGGNDDPEFQIKGARAPHVSFDPLTGMDLTPFSTTRARRANILSHETFLPFLATLDTQINTIFTSVLDAFRGLAPQIQEGLVQPLNTIFADVTRQITRKKFSGDEIGEDLATFFGTTIPREIQSQLEPVLKALQKAVQQISPVVNAFNAIIRQANEDIVKLAQQSAQQHLSLEQTIVGVQQGLFSPAQQFVVAQRQLEEARALLEQATPSQRISLIPEIQRLIQQMFGLAQNQAVLGQDPQALRNLQASLIGTLQGLQGTSAGAFGSITEVMIQQRDLAQAQITTLVNSLRTPGNVSGVVQNALVQLQNIQAALAPFSSTTQQDVMTQVQTALLTGQVQALNSIDTTQQQALTELQRIANSLIGAPGRQTGIAYVPYTGISMLHQGERVVNAIDNAHGGGGSITIHIHGGGGDSQTIAREVIKQIERRGGRLQEGNILVRN